MQAFVVHLGPQVNGFAGRDRDGRREGVGHERVGDAGHDPHVFAERLVVRDVEVVQLGAVVVADESRHLLEMLRLELDDGGGAEAVRLLAARDQRMAEQAAHRFEAVEAQESRTCREAE